MTNETNKFESFYKPLRDYNLSDDCDDPIELLGYDLCNEHATASDLEEAARYLIEAVTRDSRDWLSFDVYRNEDNSEFKAEISITLGGPTVALEYESESDSLSFSYHAGSAVVSTLISTDEYTAGGELAETIKELASAY